ncbi:MAG: substrate-binding domain-containing protein [Spirochaetia bacterium]|nr:substrate-binding domain-containing protein [Spirochaetia bacterium]
MRKNTAGKITIAFVSGRIGSVFNSAVARGVEERVAVLGMDRHSISFHSPRDNSDKASSNELKDIIRKKSADAVIALSFLPDAATAALAKKSGIPVVFIERRVRGLSSVTVDNYRGGFMAGSHLAAIGRTKPGLILDRQVVDENSASFERLSGFKDSLKKHGVKPVRGAFARVRTHDIENGRMAFDAFERHIKKVDSIFSVAGDLAAVGFMAEARAAGIRIPDHLAVIGFDGMDIAEAVEPPLTTVRQPIGEMGREAVDMIIKALKNGKKEAQNLVMQAELLVRKSAPKRVTE